MRHNSADTRQAKYPTKRDICSILFRRQKFCHWLESDISQKVSLNDTIGLRKVFNGDFISNTGMHISQSDFGRDQGITAENMGKSQHTDYNKDTTNESSSVACNNVRLGKLDTRKEWRNTSWRLWDERTEKDSAGFMDSKENKWVWVLNKAGVKRKLLVYYQSKKTSILWWHHEETRKLPGERNNARNNARCAQARKTMHSLDGQHQDVEESIRMTEERDKGIKYVHGEANPRIEDS